jgi:hypothetical protein
LEEVALDEPKWTKETSDLKQYAKRVGMDAIFAAGYIDTFGSMLFLHSPNPTR